MKIAVFEPFPRMCGVTKWTFEVVHGFRSLGHHSDVISFSKSGRTRVTNKKRRFDGSLSSGWHWWPESPDVQGKWANAVDMLNEYDLIVLNEPKNATCDREAKRMKIDAPEYVDVLKRVSTPWMTILHAPQYTESMAPFLVPTLDSPSFTGYVIEHQAGSYDSGRWAFDGRVKMIQPWPWLPYRRRADQVAQGIERQWVVGLGGRFVTNKGHHMFAWLADRFPAHYKSRLFGSESGGVGPASSFEVYEALTKHHGWSGARAGESPPDEFNNQGDKIHCWPWWLSKVDESGYLHVLEYTGGYDNPLVQWSECTVSVNMTSRKFAVGLEYTSLEAMDAGCAIVLPAYSLNLTGADQYQTHRMHKFTAPLTIGKNGVREHLGNPEEIADVIGTVHAADESVRSGSHDPAVNRAAIDQYHDPVHLARTIVEGV
jgi:hypothetical protein